MALFSQAMTRHFVGNTNLSQALMVALKVIVCHLPYDANLFSQALPGHLGRNVNFSQALMVVLKVMVSILSYKAKLKNRDRFVNMVLFSHALF